MENILFSTFLLVTFCSVVKGQYIEDKNFIWETNHKEINPKECMQIYLKADEDPTLDILDTMSFHTTLQNWVKNLHFDAKVHGSLKLKITFFKEKIHPTLWKVGQTDVVLTIRQMNRLTDYVQKLSIDSYATLGGNSVSTQGIIYLFIEDGELSGYWFRNFGLCR